MSIAAPELGEAAAGALASRGGGGGDSGTGSPAAFMISIVLIGLALVAFWLAFHTPAEWDTSGQEWPGLFARVLQWMQGKAEAPSLLGGVSFGGASEPSAKQVIANAPAAVQTNPGFAGSSGDQILEGVASAPTDAQAIQPAGQTVASNDFLGGNPGELALEGVADSEAAIDKAAKAIGDAVSSAWHSIF